MGPTLADELSTGNLPLPSLPSRKPPLEPPGAVTPPLQPMVSVPFKWEEAPGQPKPTNMTSLFRPNNCGSRCLELELPPRLVKLASNGPNTLLDDGPGVGRSVSDRFWFEDPSSNDLLGLDQGKRENMRARIVSCRWPNSKGSLDFLPLDGNGIVAEVRMNMKITKPRRSKGSLHRLSYRSSRLIESIYKSLKQMVGQKHKQKKQDTEDQTTNEILPS